MLLMQLGSALLTFIVYSSLLNWKIALLLMFGVGWHEMCHIWAAKFRGLKTGGFYLIPFIGGVSLVKEPYKTRWDQAIVVLAGPLGGGLMGALFAGASIVFHSAPLAAASVWMLFLNVFNLLPISFMDGGQIMGTFTYSISRLVGLVCKGASLALGLGLLYFMHVGGLLIFIGFFGGMEVYQEWKNYSLLKSGKDFLVPDAYLYQPKKLTTKQVVITASAYAVTATAWTILLVYMILQTKDSGFNF